MCADIVERYAIDDDALLIFFSGAKGFHVGLPMVLVGSPQSTITFHKVARHFACGLAEQLGVTIDTGVYNKVRAFCAPNSLHPKTELHKRRLTFDELLGLKVEVLVRMASEPEPFELPGKPTANPPAVDDWAAAVLAVEQETTALAHALLTEPGIDSGLAPREVRRQIECGLQQRTESVSDRTG